MVSPNRPIGAAHFAWFAGLVVALVSLLWEPSVPWLAANALYPWLLILVAFVAPGTFQLFRSKSLRPTLFFALYVQMMVLPIRAIVGVHLVSPVQLILPSAVLAAGITLAASRIDSTAKRPAQWIPFALLAAFYAWGVAAQTDVLLDHSTPQSLQSTVIGGHASYSSRHGTSYTLIIKAIGPASSPLEAPVSERLFVESKPGHPICLDFHQGALRIPWYEVHFCQSF